MKARIKRHDGFDAKSAANDCLWLLQQIKSIKLQYHESTDAFVSLMDALQQFCACTQSPGQSADDYSDRLIGWWDTLEAHGGIFTPDPKLIKEIDPVTGCTRTLEERKVLAKDRFLAAAYIRNADPSRYGTLITSLANQYAMNKDEYPPNIAAAKSLLGMYRTPVNTPTNRGAGQRNNSTSNVPTPSSATSADASGTTLAQRGVTTQVAGRDGVIRANTTCFSCNLPGHMQGECPTNPAPAGGTTLTQYDPVCFCSRSGQRP